MATTQEVFFTTVQTVMEQVFAAAGYSLVDEPYQQQGGLISFRRQTVDERLTVSYQLLAHAEYASRFQIKLERNITGATQTSTLSRLLWGEFRIQLLASPDHWWSFANDSELADALLESGQLLAAYGLPWLAGSLQPGQVSGG